MIDFKNQEEKAKKINLAATNKLSQRLKEKRITQHERIERERYKKLKLLAKYKKVTISKLLDEVIDCYLCENKIPIECVIPKRKIVWKSLSSLQNNKLNKTNEKTNSN